MKGGKLGVLICRDGVNKTCFLVKLTISPLDNLLYGMMPMSFDDDAGEKVHDGAHGHANGGSW